MSKKHTVKNCFAVVIKESFDRIGIVLFLLLGAALISLPVALVGLVSNYYWKLPGPDDSYLWSFILGLPHVPPIVGLVLLYKWAERNSK